MRLLHFSSVFFQALQAQTKSTAHKIEMEMGTGNQILNLKSYVGDTFPHEQSPVVST